ncbi:hypothetical protein CSKR_100914 [Clonorchis sinensis]|uniref:Uncharacterized protein n=1 Tax=Clonorchis sinensis TaxID=79923 RepID=A0A3R7H5A8_CLOSI|nr:hypothetical protein CSKR_100914 [Clonorchis sinensis]
MGWGEKVCERERRGVSGVSCFRLPAVLYAASKVTRLIARSDGRCGEFICVCEIQGCTWAWILPRRPCPDGRTIDVFNQSFRLDNLTTRQRCLAGNASALQFLREQVATRVPAPSLEDQEIWLEREITDRKVCGSNPTSAFRLVLSRFGQRGNIPDLVLPSGGMAARHRKCATAERVSCSLQSTYCSWNVMLCGHITLSPTEETGEQELFAAQNGTDLLTHTR